MHNLVASTQTCNKLLICCCSKSPGFFGVSVFGLSIEDKIEQKCVLGKENSLLRTALQINKYLCIMGCHLVTAWYMLALTCLNWTIYSERIHFGAG